MDPSRGLHQVPARSCKLARSTSLDRTPTRSPWITTANRPAGDRSCWPWFADVLRMYADVCILLAFVCRRSPNVCRRLHSAGHWIQGCAYFRPWDPWLCILLAMDPGLCILPAIGSKVVHRVPSRGDRSCWPWFADVLRMFADVSILLAMDPGLCILPAIGSRVVHTSGHWIMGCASSPLPWGSQLLARSALITRGNCIESRPGVDHLREIQPARRGSQLQAGPESITRWDSNQVPMDPGLCILLAMGSKVVHRVLSRGDRSC
jgi:hypothetical protein